MKIEMLGTGAIWTKYNSSSILVNNDMILDVPNGTLKQLLKSNYEVGKIKTIVITHMHGDHTADLPFLLLYICRNTQEKIVIVGPQKIEENLESLFTAYNFDIDEIKDRVEFMEVEDEKIYEINQYEIKSILVSHGELKPAYGYIINRKLGFSGDTSMCKGLEKIVKESSISIVDSSLIIGNDDHVGIDNIEYLVKKYNKKIVVTHLRDMTRLKWKKKNNNQVVVPEDGYIFEI